MFYNLIQIFSACLGAAGGVQPGRDDGRQHLRDYDNLPLQGEDQDKLRETLIINHANKYIQNHHNIISQQQYVNTHSVGLLIFICHRLWPTVIRVFFSNNFSRRYDLCVLVFGKIFQSLQVQYQVQCCSCRTDQLSQRS